MITQISKLIRTGCIVALVSAATISVTPAAMAQSVTIPTMSFPQAGTTWGCRFFGNCQNTVVVTKDTR